MARKKHSPATATMEPIPKPVESLADFVETAWPSEEWKFKALAGVEPISDEESLERELASLPTSVQVCHKAIKTIKTYGIHKLPATLDAAEYLVTVPELHRTVLHDLRVFLFRAADYAPGELKDRVRAAKLLGKLGL